MKFRLFNGFFSGVASWAVVVFSGIGAIATSAADGDLLDVRDSADAPVKMIFDTDIGGDIDDANANARRQPERGEAVDAEFSQIHRYDRYFLPF